jgi:hypothetical protein
MSDRALLGVPRVAGRKKENFDRGRVEFKADPVWIRRLHDTASRLGFGDMSNFIRFAMTKFMDDVDAERGPAGKKGGKS